MKVNPTKQEEREEELEEKYREYVRRIIEGDSSESVKDMLNYKTWIICYKI